ncbi:hypothetical protein GIB67_009045 [Kingdonia uniflora]|uniref:TMEM205-like domain-containing protein n=1 Tax=Kingdonia uniflora TaxID=39325 RepID=A0A7J7N688_9MAGN|nr:hypothetical protein GIB67_009045 [Kingdonia uniflora]
MMNIVALCLVFTSLTTAGLFSPKQPNYEREGHLLIVADKNDEPALLESKLNTETSGVLETAKEKFHKASSVLPNLGQGLSSELTQSESSSPICDAFGRCKDKITGAFSKAEESAREKTSEIGDSAREKTSQLGHKLGEVGEFAREKTSEMGHKIGEVGESTKKKASELGHKIGDSAKEKVGNQISESGEAVTEKSKKIVEGLSDWGKMLEETVGDERSLMKQKSTVLFSESGANITSLLRRSKNNIYNAAKQVASGEVLGPLLGVMHLLGFATAYGSPCGTFSPQQPKKNYERGENLLIKGHRLNVVEYEREGAAASNNNDKNDELRQGLFSESNSPGERIYDAFGRCKDKIAGAISKAKDVVSEGAHKVGEFHKASVLPNLGQGLSSESSSPGERIYDAFGRYNDKITGAFSKAKDVVSEGAHKVGEVGGAVLDMKKRALHKLGGSEAAANIASGVLETAKDKFHKASSILPNLGQGLSSESSSPGERIYDVFGRCKDKITGAFSKEKDVVSEGAHKVGEVGGAVLDMKKRALHKPGDLANNNDKNDEPSLLEAKLNTESNIASRVLETAKDKFHKASSVLLNLRQGLSSESSSPGEQIYDVFGRCKDKITGAFFKAKDVISEGAHKVGEVGRAVLDMKKRALHKPGDSANNNDKNDEPSLLEAKLDTESNIVSGVPETAKDNFHKASSILLNHGQGLYSESSSLGERIYYALGKSKDKIIGTFSKRKDIVSEGAHKVDEAGGASEESAIDKTKLMGQKIEEMGESTKEKTSEISYNIGDSEREKTNQLGEVGETAREKTRHKIGEVAESAKEKAGELEHKIGDSTKQVASGELLGPLLGVMHLLGFATTYGITVSVTFICSYVLAGTLPRQQFEIVQSKIYPVYFKALVGCIGCCLLAHVFTHWRKLDGESGRAERLQVYNLLASLGMVFFNLLYLEPRASKVHYRFYLVYKSSRDGYELYDIINVMFDRMKMEKEEGRGRTVEGEEVIEATITTAATTTTTSTTESGGRGVTATTVETSDVLTSSGRVAEQEGIRSRSAELNQRLKKLNSVSSLLNVIRTVTRSNPTLASELCQRQILNLVLNTECLMAMDGSHVMMMCSVFDQTGDISIWVLVICRGFHPLVDTPLHDRYRQRPFGSPSRPPRHPYVTTWQDDEYSSNYEEEQRPQPRGKGKGNDIEALAKVISEQTHDVHLKIPEFTRQSDADAFIEWLDNVERIFNYKKYKDPKEVMIIESQLTGFALIW